MEPARIIVERDASGMVTASVTDWQSATPRPLDPRLDLENHSPDGFECGYEGSGPAQLALAILAHILEDDARALQAHQGYKHAVIARLGGVSDGPFRWETTSNTVVRIVEKIERRGWEKVVEEFDRNRPFTANNTANRAFTRRKS